MSETEAKYSLDKTGAASLFTNRARGRMLSMSKSSYLYPQPCFGRAGLPARLFLFRVFQTEGGEAIPALYGAAAAIGSVEKHDGPRCSCGFDSPISFGYHTAEVLEGELA